MKNINHRWNYENNMYYGADQITKQKAKELRSALTREESILWEYIRNRKLEYKFRLQYPLGIYIADFYCHELKLVIEIEGEIHNTPQQKEWDRSRSSDLHMMQIEVIRFTNNEIDNNLDHVLRTIQEICFELQSQNHSPGSSPDGKE